jgi:hypothetical protein
MLSKIRVFILLISVQFCLTTNRPQFVRLCQNQTKCNLHLMSLTVFDLEAFSIDSSLWRLIDLNMRSTYLDTIKSDLFSKLNQLKFLDLSENSIEELDPILFHNNSLLEVLNLRENRIKTFGPNTKFYADFRAKILLLNENNDQITYLNGLKSIDLSDNELSKFEPEALKFATNSLMHLNMSANRFNYSRRSNYYINNLNALTNFKNLRSLDLKSLKLRLDDSDLYDLICPLKNLKRLNLCNNDNLILGDFSIWKSSTCSDLYGIKRYIGVYEDCVPKTISTSTTTLTTTTKKSTIT